MTPKPLSGKLGLKDGMKIMLINEPSNYIDLLGEVPTSLERCSDGLDFIHFFPINKADMELSLPLLMNKIVKNGMIWVSWYKKASKIPTDIIEDDIRAVALPLGLVDNKVCSVSDLHSALKLVIRKELR